nr:FKBP-type peptidyl-prolyl cis-trans isomerase [uncultured Pseudomonas sp.]
MGRILVERHIENTCDQGLMGMRVGGKRKLQVPAHLGYGERSVGAIPPNSDLTFEIELLEVLTRDD